MSQPIPTRRAKASVRAITLIFISSLMGCASIADDTNPELVRRSGDRAKVVIVDQPFQMSQGGYDFSVISSDGMARTTSIQVRGMGLYWNANEAQKLEQYFTEAMVESGAFAVIDRSVLADKVGDAAHIGLLEPEQNSTKVLRPDLKLKCTLVELNPNAEVEHSSFAARSWYWLGSKFRYGWYSWFGGGVDNVSRKANCEIKVAIINANSGETLATAKGQGSSVGSSSRVRGSGWGIGGGLSLGSSSSKDANLSLAIERATIRAVNDVLKKIPNDYFTYASPTGPGSERLAANADVAATK